MKYNFDGKVEIIQKRQINNYDFLTIKTDKFEKIIILYHDDGKTYWEFNDYAKDFTIVSPIDTKIFIEDMLFVNTNGSITVEKFPFGLFKIEAVLENCKPFETKILTGQDLNIEMKLNDDTLKKCNETIKAYQRFYEDSIKLGKALKTFVIDNNSGLYREIIDELNWYKESDIKVNKKLIESKVEKAILNENNEINITVHEVWQSEIDDNGKISSKIDKIVKNYVFSNGSPNKIVQIKAE